MIDGYVLDKVREVPLQSFVGQFVKLRRNGKSHTGLCPFHDEKTPSFSVHPKKGYTCFGCGASGSNAIDFVMAYDNTSFADAVEKVAAMSSIFIEQIPGNNQQRQMTKKRKAEPPPFNPTIIPALSVKRFEINYTRSFLFTFLSGRYGTATIDQLFRTYGVGACNLYKEFAEGATTLFIQRDMQGRVRQIGACIYDPLTGKRKRDTHLKPKRIGLPHMKRQNVAEEDIYLVQCFFGEDLLQGNTKPVAIVESEKTAMIASLHYPQFVWLATGGSFGVGKPKPETWGVLNGRSINMYPDADKLFDWIDLAAEYEDLFGEEITVHDIMAGEAIPEGLEKWDLADILLEANEPVVLLSTNTTLTPYEVAAPVTLNSGGNTFYFGEPALAGLRMESIYLSDGRSFDLLVAPDESFISSRSAMVDLIEKEYLKHFNPGTLYGYDCLLHSLN